LLFTFWKKDLHILEEGKGWKYLVREFSAGALLCHLAFSFGVVWGTPCLFVLLFLVFGKAV
jgi:hypothetical protein